MSHLSEKSAIRIWRCQLGSDLESRLEEQISMQKSESETWSGIYACCLWC